MAIWPQYLYTLLWPDGKRTQSDKLTLSYLVVSKTLFNMSVIELVFHKDLI